MKLTQLICTNFRRLEHVDFRPGPGINAIHGDNAQGKTSLLEALLFLATSKSHRTGQEADLVRYGCERFQLKACANRIGRDVALEANWWRGAKRFKVNGVPQTRISDILGKIHVVSFFPEDVALVRGSASLRRRFLDMELSQMLPAYLGALQQYRQILRQRNGLLRQGRPDADLLDAWDLQLVNQGDVLMQKRTMYVEQLAQRASDVYGRLAPRENLRASYRADVRRDAAFRDALAAARASDLKQGMTTRGPHRDDLEFMVGDKPARQFASQGQQRTIALAVKLAAMEIVRTHVDEYPVLTLDDAFSELDEKRIRRLLESVPEGVQCLLTTTEPAVFTGLFGADCSHFHIQEGHLEKT